MRKICILSIVPHSHHTGTWELQCTVFYRFRCQTSMYVMIPVHTCQSLLYVVPWCIQNWFPSVLWIRSESLHLQQLQLLGVATSGRTTIYSLFSLMVNARFLKADYVSGHSSNPSFDILISSCHFYFLLSALLLSVTPFGFWSLDVGLLTCLWTKPACVCSSQNGWTVAH